MRQAGIFGLSKRLKRLSAYGDPLQGLGCVLDFEAFRPTLMAALAYSDGTKDGRPPYDLVTMLKVLILAAQNTVSDARMEYLIRDRLNWLRFLGFDLGAPTPDANTIRVFREKLTEGGALDALFADFDRQLKERSYLPMGGQIVDATLISAPKQCNTEVEKAAVKEGNDAGEIWPDEPAKARQEDTDAPWTLKFAKARPIAEGKPQADIAIPSFGYKSRISICRAFGFIRRCKVSDDARFDGRMLRAVVTNDNAASDVWADTAYRRQASEKWLKRQGRVSRIHRRKPRGRPMLKRTAKANAAKSKIRARVEHVFAHQKDKMGLFICTIDIKRTEATITLANLAYNMNRLIFHERRVPTGSMRPKGRKHGRNWTHRRQPMPFALNPGPNTEIRSDHVVNGGAHLSSRNSRLTR